MESDPMIDTIILGCTHYPLLMPKIRKHLPKGVSVVAQGDYVASSLADYLNRRTAIASQCSKGGTVRYLTTENPQRFQETAQLFLNQPVEAMHIMFT
jgi:glutamate racemase